MRARLGRRAGRGPEGRAAATPWTCIVCGEHHAGPPPDIRREGGFCPSCQSSLRNRATVLALLYGLAYEPQPIADLPEDWSRRGVGCSDHVATAGRLAGRMSYTNTYYHRYPRLDVLRPPEDLLGELEFVICSNVMEHVEPPHQRGYEGLYAVLRDGGFAVVSIPVFDQPHSFEHYPGMARYELLDGPAVRWWDQDGVVHLDQDPEMHDGEGLVLAFRRFAPADEAAALERAGFHPVWEVPPCPELGVFPLPHPGAGVFLARKGQV